MAEEQALPVRIQVLEGELSQATIQADQPPGVIMLKGTELPYQPLNLGMTQRNKTTYYPGNPIASQQVSGPTLKPTKLTGTWKDIKLGAGRARQLMDLFDDLCARGVQIEMSWGDRIDDTGEVGGDPIVRRGIVSDTDWKIDRVQDIHWEIEFTWRSRGQDQSSPPVVGISTASHGFSDAVDALNDVDSQTQSFLDMASVKLFGIADPLFNAMQTALADITTANDAIDLANGAINFNAGVTSYVAQSIMGSVSLALDSLQVLENTLLALRFTDLVPTDDALGLLKIKDQILGLLQVTSSARERMGATRDAAATHVLPDVIASVRVSAGTDLRDLALKYYGDADSWWAIAQYNNFPTSEVPTPPTGPSDDPGLPVQIPRLQPGPSSNLRAAC